MSNFIPARVTEVKFLRAEGPFRSKSGAALFVPLQLPLPQAIGYMQDIDRAVSMPVDIRGLRVYAVVGINKGCTAGIEFHRIRKEYVFTIVGEISWEVEDFYGDKQHFTTYAGQGLYIPPSIMHSGTGVAESSTLFAVASVLYDSSNKDMIDTYLMEEFRKEQVRYR